MVILIPLFFSQPVAISNLKGIAAALYRNVSLS